MKRLYILILLLFLLFSCSSGLYNELSRYVADPNISKPIVISFSEEKVVKINWEKDELADEYILYRALDSAVLNFEELYRGTDCFYRDIDGTDREIYHYCLSKVRGTKIFEMSDSVTGVFSITTADIYENNDTKEQATLLRSDLIANIFGFRDTFYSEITSDEDWYSVIIPPRRTAHIILRQLSPAPSGENSHFDVYVEGNPAEPVKNSGDIAITNTFDYDREYYFKFYPNAGKFFPLPTTGGTIVSYQLSLGIIE